MIELTRETHEGMVSEPRYIAHAGNSLILLKEATTELSMADICSFDSIDRDFVRSVLVFPLETPHWYYIATEIPDRTDPVKTSVLVDYLVKEDGVFK